MLRNITSQQQSSEYHKIIIASPSVSILDPKSRPLAIHQLIVVDPTGFALVRLSSYSKKTPSVSYDYIFAVCVSFFLASTLDIVHHKFSTTERFDLPTIASL